MNEIFEHVLVPYNGCLGSQKAFKKAIDLVQLTNSKITILTCLEDRATFGLFKTKTQKQEFENEHKLVTQEHLKLGEYAKKKNISLDSKITKSDMVARTILEFADKHNVDLIVMGMKNLTKYEKIHYPSTIEDVSKNFHGAILILN
jgi:nucleotide-binding universal stress UspA family protein